jgi:F420-dependent oxidoreductase-like protein
MKLGLSLGYWGRGPDPDALTKILEAESMGFDSMWTAEAWGSDALTPLAWYGSRTTTMKLGQSITQISARTPAATAMAMQTLQHLSDGRVICGLGVSGPQVVEGWYGQPFKRPLERTREWLAIFRKVLAREEPVTFDGAQYHLPYAGDGGSGLGKPLMSITHPLRRDIPIFLGAEGPKNVALAVEQLDGWLIFLTPYDKFSVWDETLRPAKPGFEVIANVGVQFTDDALRALLPVKKVLALYIGGMGAKEENFHKRLVERYGYKDAADRIQELWLSGRQKEAVMAVPDELADAVSLVGSREHVREKLRGWKRSPVTTLLMGIGPGEPFEQTVANMEFLAAEVL